MSHRNSQITFHHVRNVGKGKRENYTFAIIPTKTLIFIGVSKCSKRDQFDKKIGREIAFERASHAAYNARYGGRLPNWTIAIDRKDYGLEGDRIKREIVAITRSELPSLQRLSQTEARVWEEKFQKALADGNSEVNAMVKASS